MRYRGAAWSSTNIFLIMSSLKFIVFELPPSKQFTWNKDHFEKGD